MPPDTETPAAVVYDTRDGQPDAVQLADMRSDLAEMEAKRDHHTSYASGAKDHSIWIPAYRRASRAESADSAAYWAQRVEHKAVLVAAYASGGQGRYNAAVLLQNAGRYDEAAAIAKAVTP